MPADDVDRFGFEETTDHVGVVAGKFLPQWLGRRAIDVTVSTDRRGYEVGEPVEFTVEFRNRLPVSVSLRTPTRRLWGWAVDGQLAASDERRYLGETGGSIDFRGGERRRITRQWNGLFKRTGERTRWVEPSPGEYELSAFLAVEGNRPEDATTVRIG